VVPIQLYKNGKATLDKAQVSSELTIE